MQQSTLHSWTNHPVTKVLMRKLKEIKTSCTEMAIKGQILESSTPLEGLAKIVAKVNLIDEIVSLDLIKEEHLEIGDEE